MNKEIVTAKKMSYNLIGEYILWGVVFGIGYYIVYFFISNLIHSSILKIIISLILQGITSFLAWKTSTKLIFKKKTILFDSIHSVMKSLIIFTIIICILNGVYQFYKINKKIDETVNSSIISYFYNDKQIAKLKTQTYIYFAITQVSLAAVYLAVLPLEKKEILKHVAKQE